MTAWPCVLGLSVTVVGPELLKELFHLSRGEYRKGPGRTGLKDVLQRTAPVGPPPTFHHHKSCHSFWRTLKTHSGVLH